MNKKLAEQMTFGLKSMIPKDATVAWGARWIIQESWKYKDYIRKGSKGRRPKRFLVDAVWDRQSFAGSDEEIQAFKKELNKGGKTRSAVVLAHRKAERLFNDYQWEFCCASSRSAGPKVLFRDKRLEIVGDPRSSGGYIYVIAYPRSQPEQATGEMP